MGEIRRPRWAGSGWWVNLQMKVAYADFARSAFRNGHYQSPGLSVIFSVLFSGSLDIRLPVASAIIYVQIIQMIVRK